MIYIRWTVLLTWFMIGKSLEEVDEIFGDVKTVREEDIKMPLASSTAIETVEYRPNKTGTGV